MHQAKAKPADHFSSAGTGSISRVAIKAAAQAVGAGDVDFGVIAVPGVMPFLKSGKGKVIA